MKHVNRIVRHAKRFLKRFPKLTRKQWAGVGIGVGGLLFAWFLFSVFVPQKVTFKYTEPHTCVASPRLFPGLLSTKYKEPFRVYRPASLSIGKLTLFAKSICIEHKAAPKAVTTYTYRERFFGLNFLSRSLAVATPTYPRIVQATAKKQLLPPDGTLKIRLSEPDATFHYTATTAGANATALCKSQRNTADVECDLTPLKLEYKKAYAITIKRTYNKQGVSKLTTIPVETISPVSVLQTSIAPAAIVQEKPKQIIVHTDKTIKRLGTVELIATAQGTGTAVPISSTIEDNRVIVTINQELTRKVSFELRIASIEAVDGSGFAAKSYTLPFSTSGGPKVKSASIGSRNVPLDGSVTLTFDQDLAPSQPISKNVGFIVNGALVPASVTLAGNRVQIKPTSALPLCTPFTITVDSAVQSHAGVAGDSTWSLKSRTMCYTTFSIGTSVKGRSITAYRFGTGSSMIVYLGAMHGSERNSKAIMDEWFKELNAHPERLPAGRSIVIIPSVNPDGIAAGTRFNARGVDLNRNFPANDWKSVVTTPVSSQPTAAGGPAPLSEPESQAVAAFIRQHSPRLVLSFHSKAAVVEANEAGDSLAIAREYASKARYRAISKSQSAPVFQYDTTGAMEDWMRDKLGRPAIVIELATSTSSEFGRNKNALWYSVGL